jgi:beta-glucosidase
MMGGWREFAFEVVTLWTIHRFMHPLVYGDYPPVMRRNVGSRLPELTPDESARVRGSFDFVGINQYGAILVEADLSQLKRKLRDYYGDTAAKFVTRKHGNKK